MRIFWLSMLVLGVIAVVLLWLERASSGSEDRTGGVAVAPPADVAVTTAWGVEPAPADSAPAAGRIDPIVSVTEKTAVTEKPADERPLLDDFANAETEDGGAALADVLNDGSVPAPTDGHDSGPDTEGGIDDKYILAGDGSMETPYEITWDLLLLASQTYRPREGKTEIPATLEAVNGKRIAIDGYFAFPMASTDSREVLFMLNMWDGCCIGLPPSPYDAIEVRLKEPLGGKKQFVNYGTLTGTLKVDPYVQNGWLLGMYLMEDGELEIGM